MLLSAFLKWCFARYSKCGSVLNDIYFPPHAPVCWEFTCGFFALMPGKEPADNIIMYIYFKKEQRKTLLDEKLRFPVEEAGETWLIEMNEYLYRATLRNIKTGTAQQLYQLFGLQPPKPQMTGIKAFQK